jgi:WD40 repeat protein
VLALAVSLRDSRVASGALDGTIKFWDLVNGRVPCLGRRDHDNIVLATALAGSNLAATSGGNDNEIHLWDAESGKLTRALVGVGRAIWSVGFSPDGRAIAWGVERA